ncbi:DUF3078 domain-containing protein [Lutimonas saemankumensis]|uniref:DUF3078 domain-containing protein n=1 Tax=Lutimonas saemankumensis TaxID=483016 RepID=UPI001CD623AE|nr:DUF3078 domain-containing protein [Lutimonas saemankumensis]MCA0932801.1 DUF3078 domain-containing protein [Lutimonas saemankumensis]
MSKTIKILFLALFFITSARAQIKDSVDVKIAIDTMALVQSIDSSYLQRPLYPEEDKMLDSLQGSIPEQPQMISVERALLDSLLSPYYNIEIDSTKENDLGRYIVITPKYRMTIDPYSGDTSYVPIPKKLDYFTQLKSVGIDTVGFYNAIELVQIKRTKKARDPVWWKHENSVGLDLNEVAFVNWNAGGQNSISGLFKVFFARNYEKLYTLWNNEISARYGLNNQQNTGLIKTDDEIRISSSFGYRKDTISKWYFSSQFNFRTQFTDGYKEPDDEDPISRFFAPAYLHLGIGSKYYLKDDLFSIYMSPLTLKATYVFDEKLSNEGAFGVTPGENSRHELGILIRSKWEKEIFKNVAMVNDLELYTDYINNFGNIDVDWVLSFQFKINKVFQASFRTHLIYDDDIKIKETNEDGEVETLGARVQLKQQLGIGIIYNF